MRSLILRHVNKPNILNELIDDSSEYYNPDNTVYWSLVSKDTLKLKCMSILSANKAQFFGNNLSQNHINRLLTEIIHECVERKYDIVQFSNIYFDNVQIYLSKYQNNELYHDEYVCYINLDFNFVYEFMINYITNTFNNSLLLNPTENITINSYANFDTFESVYISRNIKE